MGSTRKYWKGIEELKQTSQFLESKDQEFPTQLPVEEFLGDESLKETSTDRRDFLKFLGFSVAAATVAACEAPVTKVIPYVNKPENVTPGLATWYASTYYDGTSYASIVVKTREGRPIFIKGNKDYGVTSGATNAQIIASVLGLYDSERLTGASLNGKAKDNFSAVDGDIKKELQTAKKVVLVSNTIISPSMRSAIDDLSISLGGVRAEDGSLTNDKFEHIQYDAVSYAGMRAANKASFGMDIIPDYDFTKAKQIISIGADFLNSWLMPTKFTPDYGKRRNPDGEWMSEHFQFESMMSITGSNADYRGMIKPSQQAEVLSYLLSKYGVSAGNSKGLSAETKAIADRAYKSMSKSGASPLVVCGSNNKSVQILANKLNSVCGAYTKTININNELNLFKSEDAKMNAFVKDVVAKKGPDAVMFLGVNPGYTLLNGSAFLEGLKGKTTISFASHADETASKCKYVCPDHHALEGWADYSVSKGNYAIAQPTIRPLHGTASAMESILVWAGVSERGGKDSKVAHEYIKGLWKQYGFPGQTKYADFHTYWNMMVHNSCGETIIAAPTAPSFDDGALSGLKLPKTSKDGDTEVVMYQKAGIGIGTQANNPWLQELPDPMTKATWDNYITMNPVEMSKAGYATTYDQEHGLSMAKIKVGSVEHTLPVFPLPGQALGTVGVALGYGRGANGEKIGRASYQTKEYGGYVTLENGNPAPIGVNAFDFVSIVNDTMSYDAVAKLTLIEGAYPIASTQIHQTVMGRHSIVRETTKSTYDIPGSKEAYNPAWTLPKMDEHGNHVQAPMDEFNLWDEHPVENIGHRWGMTVDLSACIGCGACLIACQAENNVPVVGKDEVRKGREMHWLRIDRYFASDEEATIGQRKDKKTFSFGEAEIAAQNPKVVHMPMMCHHCNHAPCETVCPVAATNHSNEGLNQMAYNRCIGTRYCANNCPYKVRRFNWFNYPSYKAQTEINPAQDDIGRMVLNPDVTVRTRGVMEKCSFCVQRIQEGKLDAKTEGRPVVDGDFTSACSDSCPTNAITVGDWNDLKSMVRSSSEDKRAYQALEEVGVKPNVWYKVKVRNEENSVLDKLQVVKESAHGEDHGGGHDTEGHGENNSH